MLACERHSSVDALLKPVDDIADFDPKTGVFVMADFSNTSRHLLNPALTALKIVSERPKGLRLIIDMAKDDIATMTKPSSELIGDMAVIVNDPPTDSTACLACIRLRPPSAPNFSLSIPLRNLFPIFSPPICRMGFMIFIIFVWHLFLRQRLDDLFVLSLGQFLALAGAVPFSDHGRSAQRH